MLDKLKSIYETVVAKLSSLVPLLILITSPLVALVMYIIHLKTKADELKEQVIVSKVEGSLIKAVEIQKEKEHASKEAIDDYESIRAKYYANNGTSSDDEPTNH